MNTKNNEQGTVWSVPVRPGRRRKFGSLAFVEGHAAIFIGFSEDRMVAYYVPRTMLHLLRGAYVKTGKQPIYRMIKWLMRHYEVSQGLTTIQNSSSLPL